MSFAAEWLELRAPADAAARDPGLAAAAAAWLGEGLALDLGCGTGAACAAFPAGVRWRLVDADARLLAVAAGRWPGAEVVRADLADLGRLPFAGVRLVTAFALLDLAGAAWIERLAERVAAVGAGLYAPLCYDGTLAWEPVLPGDEAVRQAFNVHQRRDKGLGPALGPGAAAAMARAMAARGYRVRLGLSPWRLGAEDGALHRALVAGIAAAAEAGLGEAAAWGQARVAATAWRCTVGHLDVLALPAGASAQSKTTSESRP